MTCTARSQARHAPLREVAVKGYRVKLFLPENASRERKRILKAYGAEVILTDRAEGTDGAIRACREEYRRDPGAYFYPDQYNNRDRLSNGRKPQAGGNSGNPYFLDRDSRD